MKLLRELLEGSDVKTKNVYAAHIYGGRGGDDINIIRLDFPIDVSAIEFEDMAEDRHELYELTPNSGDAKDVEKMIKTVAAGKVYSDWNVGGDGAYAVGSNKKAVELAVYKTLHDH